jgi:hypothetical protein
MLLQRLKHTLLRLSIEEKVIGVGALAVIVGLFMPWYSVVLNFNDMATSESGFSGDLGVIGFVVFLFMLLGLGFLLAGHFRFRLPQFGFKKESILLFLSGESAFLLLLAAAIYTKRSLDYTNAELRFGLYVALIGSILATFAAFALLQKIQKKEAKAFFEHGETEPETAEEPQVEEALPEEPVTQPKHHTRKTVEKPVEQERFFEEERAYQPKMESVGEPAAELSVEESMAPETIVEELETPTTPSEELSAPSQGNYFLHDAGLKSTEAHAMEQKKEEGQTPINRDMGFYNDL